MEAVLKEQTETFEDLVAKYENNLPIEELIKERRLDAYGSFLREIDDLRRDLLGIDSRALSSGKTWETFDDEFDFTEAQRRLDRLKTLKERIKADTFFIEEIKKTKTKLNK